MTARDHPVALVVEQDPVARTFLGDNLLADGFDVKVTANAHDGLRAAALSTPDIAIVGVNGGSGRDFARLVRQGDGGQDPRLPMILLGGDAHEIDTLRAFDAGADDYLAKPFSYPVLYARARALLRRVELDSPAALMVRTAGPLRIDGAARTATFDGQPIMRLTKKEWALLWTLAGDPARVFAKRELVRAVGVKNGAGSIRTLDSHACRLRHKLPGDGWIANVWGHGYRLRTVREVVA
jgi:DNA-binding response OmpR family regulator